eukprot:241994-Rhodomonas_salina.1
MSIGDLESADTELPASCSFCVVGVGETESSPLTVRRGGRQPVPPMPRFETTAPLLAFTR